MRSRPTHAGRHQKSTGDPPPTPNRPHLSTTPNFPPPTHPLQRHIPYMTHLLLTPIALATLLTPNPPAQPPTQPAPPPAPSAMSPAQSAAVWPLSPRPQIVRGFEPPPKPWLPGHRGLDLRGSPGQQVRSATPGKVTYAAPLVGRGVIVITNGPLRTTYEPVIPTIRVGTEVTPGTPLGHLSAAGSHCAPATCLHWGLLQATTYLNPLSLLPHRPIRLLPRTQSPPQATNPRPTPAPTSSPQPSANPTPQPPAPRSGPAPAVIVGLAAAATLISSLLIKPH